MGDRLLTNILLAVIAAVLLFGRSAVLGALKWAAIIGGALLLLYGISAFALYLLRESAKSLREAKARGRDAFAIALFGLAALAFLPVFFGYALLLWFDGASDPFNSATHSWVGTTWLTILIIGGISIVLSLLYTHRADIGPALRYGLSLLIRSPLAPLFLTIYGWRKARMAGDGVVASTASAFVGLFFGLMFWMVLLTIVLSILSSK